MSALHDMHCHLGFMSNAHSVAADAAREGAFLFANTISPGEWLSVSDEFKDAGNVRVGFGAHPWWAPHSRNLEELLETYEPRFIGEVGLDAGDRHAPTLESQMESFKQIVRWSTMRGERLLSIHSVRAARQVIDTLETYGACTSCTCIFHWYSGPSDQLKRAIDKGCYFSVGQHMLKTKKGREYVKAIPLERLMLETDDPPGQGVEYSYAQLRENLEAAARNIEKIKGEGSLETISKTSLDLLANI